MMKKYQVTLYCTTGEYRPVSCIVERDNEIVNKIGKQGFIDKLKKEGVQKICAQRNWDRSDLVWYHYTRMKMREYSEEKIKTKAK